jgi:PHD/YefM family antitoxin component YafN of YafNO toxin-antitoxin module
MKATKRAELVYDNGEPVAIILDLPSYEEMLERLEDAEDLAMLRAIRSRPLHLRTLEQFLEDHAQAV